MNNHLKNYCLRIADNSWILGNRLAAYISHGPFLEEDLAITNVGLDHVGLAEALYNYVGEATGTTGDDLAFKRSEDQYLNCHLVEYPNKDFAYIMVRQFFFDNFNYHFFNYLKNSHDPILSALAHKTCKEVVYHLKRSSEWMIRLGDGTDVSNTKMQEALNELWMYVEELFVMDETDHEMIKVQIGVDLEVVRTEWNNKTNEVLSKAKLEKPDLPVFSLLYGKQGYHTDFMGYILSELQYLTNKYPQDIW